MRDLRPGGAGLRWRAASLFLSWLLPLTPKSELALTTPLSSTKCPKSSANDGCANVAPAAKWGSRRSPCIPRSCRSRYVYATVSLDWQSGLRYPRLEKVGRGQGTLDALLAPR